MNSIFDEINLVKEHLSAMTEQALQNSWIPEADARHILSGLQKEKITIGVIGQMKNGKSTLLNAFIFGKDVLPSATVPTTANLTIISHSDTSYAEIEFFSPGEWEQLQQTAALPDESDVVKAARELIQQAGPIRHELPGLLGTKRRVSMPEIVDFASASGPYAPVTKSIQIGYPHARLKNADFVDTPGFNDPVVSREQRTREFLEKADAVIVVLYAGRGFDDRDESILFEQLRAAGTGKVVLLVNKYDLVLDQLGSEEKVVTSVENKLRQQIVKLEKTDPVLAGVFKETRPILFSSLFALFGKLGNAEPAGEELKEYYQLFRDKFPQLKTSQDFLRWSHLETLESHLESIIKKERLQIILRKPATELIGKIKKHQAENRQQIILLEKTRETLSKTREQIQQEKASLAKAAKEITSLVLETREIIHKELIRNCNDCCQDILTAKDTILRDDVPNLPARPLMQTNDAFINNCKRFIEDKLIDFRRKVSKELSLLAKKVHLLYEVQTRELDLKITSLATDLLNNDSEALIRLKNEFFSILDLQLSEIDYRIDISIAGAWGFFFGVSRNEIIDVIRNEISSKFSIEKVRDMIGAIKQPAKGILERFNDFGEEIIGPVEQALERAGKALDEKSSLQEKIGPDIERLTRELETQSQFISQLEDFLNRHTNFSRSADTNGMHA